MSPKSFLTSLIIALILVGVGGAGGFVYKMQQDKSVTDKITWAENVSKSVNLLSSSFCPAVVAQGKISSFSKGSMTLVNLSGDKLTIDVTDNIKVFLVTKQNPSPETYNYNNIKIGDLVNMNVNIVSDGKIKGYEITVYRMDN